MKNHFLSLMLLTALFTSHTHTLTINFRTAAGATSTVSGLALIGKTLYSVSKKSSDAHISYRIQHIKHFFKSFSRGDIARIVGGCALTAVGIYLMCSHAKHARIKRMFEENTLDDINKYKQLIAESQNDLDDHKKNNLSEKKIRELLDTRRARFDKISNALLDIATSETPVSNNNITEQLRLRAHHERECIKTLERKIEILETSSVSSCGHDNNDEHTINPSSHAQDSKPQSKIKPRQRKIKPHPFTSTLLTDLQNNGSERLKKNNEPKPVETQTPPVQTFLNQAQQSLTSSSQSNTVHSGSEWDDTDYDFATEKAEEKRQEEQRKTAQKQWALEQEKLKAANAQAAQIHEADPQPSEPSRNQSLTFDQQLLQRQYSLADTVTKEDLQQQYPDFFKPDSKK